MYDGLVGSESGIRERTRTVEEIAIKDVPTGKEYHIVDVADIPSDRTFRDAWTWE